MSHDQEIERAIEFANHAHTSLTPDGKPQLRKYSGEPYIVHPKAVAAYLSRKAYPTDVIVAAILHDVLEDTTMSYADLRCSVKGFGKVVADLVLEVTNPSKAQPELPRALRKQIDRQYLAGASLNAKAIKCADIIDNLSDIAERDKAFAPLYLKEQGLLLQAIRNGKQRMPHIWYEALSVLHGAEELIL